MATGVFGNFMYDDPVAYQQAHDAWVAGGKQGDEPVMSAGGRTARSLSVAGFNPQVPNSEYWQTTARLGANAPMRENPYSNAVADQSRAAQLALLQQMRGQMAGPSIASMQGQRALGQSGQQALMGSALGNGRAAMLQSGQVGGSLAGDVAQARLAEQMRAQAGIGGLAGSLRGLDQRSAEAQQRSGLGMQGLDLAQRQGYAGLGARQSAAEAAAALELYKAQQRANVSERQTNVDALKSAMGPLAVLLGGLQGGTK